MTQEKLTVFIVQSNLIGLRNMCVFTIVEQLQKAQKNMDLIFCKVKKAQKTCI
eukprot:UN08171